MKRGSLALLVLASCSAVNPVVVAPAERVGEFRRVCPKEPKTDSYLCRLGMQKKIELEDVVKGEGFSMRLWTSLPAREIIGDERFDVKRKPFSREKFFGFISSIFSDSMAYYNSFAPHPVSDVHLVVDDFGNARKSVSANAIVGTGIMSVDIRRWHKMWSGYGAWRAGLSSFHEYVHVQNYSLDPLEDKRFREFTAIVFESANIIRKHGIGAYLGHYSKKVVHGLEPERVIDDGRWNMAALRETAYRLVVNMSNGLYTFQGDSVEDKLKEFAVQLIKSRKTGEEGFNQAAASSGILFAGRNLDFDTLQRHAYEAIKK